MLNQNHVTASLWLTQKQVKALYEACGDGLAGLRDRVLLGLMVTTGVRRSEAISIRWSHIVKQPFEGELCSILNVIGGKGGKDRSILLTPQMDRLLAQWVQHTGRGGLVMRALGNELVVGDSLSSPAVYYICRKRGALIGVPALAPHDLRRTFAQSIWQRTGDLLVVSELLGHTSLDTTRRYLMLDQAKKRDAVRAIAWG